MATTEGKDLNGLRRIGCPGQPPNITPFRREVYQKCAMKILDERFLVYNK